MKELPHLKNVCSAFSLYSVVISSFLAWVVKFKAKKTKNKNRQCYLCLQFNCGTAGYRCGLTQQYQHAQQDGDKRSSAEACRRKESLALTDFVPGATLTLAHTQGQCAGAAQQGLTSIPHHHRQLIHLLSQPVETAPPRYNASRAV